MQDDDDWVGTPPEGRHTRDRADPAFWRRQRFVAPTAAAITILVIAVVLAAILR